LLKEFFMKKLIQKNIFLFFLFSILFMNSGCDSSIKNTPRNKALFTLVNNTKTNIYFKNIIKENLYFNFLNYSYIYNGGGVAVGDINNDGLEDIYFTSNQNSNKLYVNKGDFEFEDITKSAHLTDAKGWTTGVTMVDINNDGWLDIYVCKSGSLQSDDFRKNKLYINQKNNTFKESATQYGLDYDGFSVQSYFFDFDNDGDLDMYLVNHRPDFRNSVTIDLERDKAIKVYSSDQLYRNDNGTYTNVTKTAGISNRTWGLSASIGDFNNDGWLDVFVANDFYHPDFLYINNKNGTFTDDVLNRFSHISNNSMGSDFADINNDLQPDLLVLDMLAEDHIRSKKNMASMNTNSFNLMVNAKYHHQYMTNTLQLNRANGMYSEVSLFAGIAKTDWSWAPLIADFDNDGHKDIFITNGIENDLSNQDFRKKMERNIMNRKKVTLDEAIAMMPSEKLQNYSFKNNGNLSFTNTSDSWGLTQKINSNGAAYADLDNDGDLDLIVNNQSDFATIYKNNSNNNHISFTLKGSAKNRNGVGSKIILYSKNNKQIKHAFVSRGYQSSVSSKIHFGLGKEAEIDSVIISWGMGLQETLKNISINKNIHLQYKNATKKAEIKQKEKQLFTNINPTTIGVNYRHKENVFNDFDLQLLLPQKQSEITSSIAVADINNDGLDDFFVGNAKGASAALYIQKSNGTFYSSNLQLFSKEKKFEDTDALFFDADNDGDIDLYVASGGYELNENSPLLQDRLYVNNGNGIFTKSSKLPPMLSYTKGITTADFDNDGDLDLFVGSRVIPGKYPLSNPSYLLENNHGNFTNVTQQKLPDFSDIKMVNDAIFSDFDNDGDADLIVVGEWMPIIFYENKKGLFRRKEIPELTKSDGWQQTIKEFDMDNDGHKDYFIGNWGNNNKFHPTKENPLHIYAGYFDKNNSFDIVLSKKSKGKMVPIRGKECSTQQTPFLGEKIGSFNQFAISSLSEIYGEDRLENATHYKAYNFSSIILKNNGNGTFKQLKLPEIAQFSPTLGVTILDSKNKFPAIFGIGNVYDSEVETIRYDASQNYLLLNSGMQFQNSSDTSFLTTEEAKAIETITINKKTHLLILNKNSALTVLRKQ